MASKSMLHTYPWSNVDLDQVSRLLPTMTRVQSLPDKWFIFNLIFALVCEPAPCVALRPPHVAPAPGALLLRSDVERKRLFGVAETEHPPPGTYSAEASAKVYGIVADKAARVLAAGHSAIVDAVFAKQEERTKVEIIATSAHAAFLRAISGCRPSDTAQSRRHARSRRLRR